MDLKAHALKSLDTARMMTESILEAFKTDDDWFYQSHPKANHALWIVGHLGLADNMFASKFRPEVDRKPDGWEEIFWFGSRISSDRTIYPTSGEALAYLRDRRETLLKVVTELGDDELMAPAPGPNERSAIAGAPCVGHIFLFAAYHEGMHTGQLSIAHRGLGNDPLFGPQPQEQANA